MKPARRHSDAELGRVRVAAAGYRVGRSLVGSHALEHQATVELCADRLQAVDGQRMVAARPAEGDVAEGHQTRDLRPVAHLQRRR